MNVFIAMEGAAGQPQSIRLKEWNRFPRSTTNEGTVSITVYMVNQ